MMENVRLPTFVRQISRPPDAGGFAARLAAFAKQIPLPATAVQGQP